MIKYLQLHATFGASARIYDHVVNALVIETSLVTVSSISSFKEC